MIFIAKSNSAFDDDLLNVFARLQVSERVFDNCPAVQQALIFRRVHAKPFLACAAVRMETPRGLSSFEQSLLKLVYALAGPFQIGNRV